MATLFSFVRVWPWLLGASASAMTGPLAPSGADPDKFEGALGVVTSYAPSYPGASDYRFSTHPAGFIRYGRWTVTGSGGFTTQRKDEVENGLEAELGRSAHLRVSLGLRLHRGRDESRSPQLVGMGDIPTTLRARLLVRYRPTPDTLLSVAMSPDVLGRDGGVLADVGAAHQWSFGHVRVLIASVGAQLADRRFMQSWHGVNPQQALQSGYAVFNPSAGVRSLGTGLTYRHDFGAAWASFVTLSHSRMVGSAADSPLTLQPSATWLTGGLAYRF